MTAIILFHTVAQFCCWLGFMWLFVQELRS